MPAWQRLIPWAWATQKWRPPWRWVAAAMAVGGGRRRSNPGTWVAGTELARYPQHDGPVWGVAISGDGQRAATSSDDKTVRLWDIAGDHREPTQTLREHPESITAVAFHPDDSSLLATGGDDGTVRVWHADDGRPHWRAPILLPSPPELLTHRGWIRFDGKRTKHEETAWRTALETEARTAAHHRTEAICLVSHDGRLQRWDRATDRMLRQWPGLAGATIHALAQGCVTLADGKLRLHGVDGAPRQLGDHCSAMALAGDQLVGSCRDEIAIFDARGAKVTSYPAAVGVTALDLNGDRLLLGYANGNLERVPLDAEVSAPLPFQDTPASPVVRIVAGPMDTVAVGYANGALGLWSLVDGARLYLSRMHGPVRHLLLSGHQLIAATELGSHHAFDLSAFYLSHCEPLERAWQAIDVVWEHGRAVQRGRPSDHLCGR